MRKKLVVGNWKMNLLRNEGISLVNDILKNISSDITVNIVLAPSFLHLYKVSKMTSDLTYVSTAAQDCSLNSNGSFTGEVSAKMIFSCGAEYVILGHSERRSNFQETSRELRTKTSEAISNNLNVIFCCGESIKQRKDNTYFDWIKSQISEGLFHLSSSDFANIVIAYEPIWAIGTGANANSKQAQEVHEFIRNLIEEEYDKNIADNTSILYGGSCNAANAIELFSEKDVDGGLIGGASLDCNEFISIINSF
tara:strand:+ start:1525 stop:2280 length:756 start_codon:yes stop_codon:yes gene_type:complete